MSSEQIPCPSCGCLNVTLSVETNKDEPDAIIVTCPACGAMAEIGSWIMCRVAEEGVEKVRVD